MKVLALLAGAAALDVVHAHGDRVVAGVDHGAVARVSEAAVRLAAGAVAPLEFAADLEEKVGNKQGVRRKKYEISFFSFPKLEHYIRTFIKNHAYMFVQKLRARERACWLFFVCVGVCTCLRGIQLN